MRRGLLFGDRVVPWSGARGRGGAAVRLNDAALPAAPPGGELQGVPDAMHGGSWRGRPVTPRDLAVGITPAKVAAAARKADQGYPGDLYEMIEAALRRDAHGLSVIQTRKRAVANAAWSIVPASDKRRDVKIAEACGQMVLQVPAFRAALTDLMHSIVTGFWATEIEWATAELPGGYQVRPAQMHYRPARHFRPSPENPNVWRLLDKANLIDGVPLQPGGWICHMARPSPGFPAQAGLGRVLLWYWLLQHYALKDWASYSELYGAPTRVGKFPATASSQQISALADALNALGVNSYAAIPDGFSLEVVGDTATRGGPDVYQKLIDYCDRAKSKLILGQTLTTEGSDRGSGSYALGQVHNSVRLDIRQADAGLLGETLTRDLLRPFVLWNFGPQAAVPQFDFDVEPPADVVQVETGREKRAKVFAAGLALGLPLSRAQIREELALREPESEEDTLERAAAKPEPDPGSVSGDDPDDEPPSDDEDGDEDGEE